MRTLVIHVVLPVVFLWVAAFAEESAPGPLPTSQLDQQWLDTVVSIERQASPDQEVPIGTGFIVQSERGHLLLATAKHVVLSQDGKLYGDLVYRLNRISGSTLLLKDADLVASGGGPWFLSDDNDLAVRFLPVVQGASIKAIPLDRTVDVSQVAAGTPIVVLGFPMGLRSTDHAKPIARRGMLARAESTLLIADVLIFPGNSGGPALYVPAFKTGGVSFGGAEVVPREMLVGLVLSFIPYTDVAVSRQTNRPRVTFEENSGLANLVPVWSLKDFISSQAIASFEAQLGKRE